MGLRERAAQRMRKKMSQPIARHLEAGEYVEMRPVATVEFQGRHAECSAYVTDRAIYLVVEHDHIAVKIPVENIVLITTDLPRFALKWADPTDGTYDGLMFSIMPATTASLFVSYVLKAYERVTGHPLGEQPTSDV